jgi:hypothetical protein
MGDDHQLRKVTVRGIVVPTEWDSRGQVLQVAILTPDEEQYDIVDSELGRRLVGALREEIEACLRIEQSQQNRRRATVLSHQIVDADDDDYVLEDLLKEPGRGEW